MFVTSASNSLNFSKTSDLFFREFIVCSTPTLQSKGVTDITISSCYGRLSNKVLKFCQHCILIREMTCTGINDPLVAWSFTESFPNIKHSIFFLVYKLCIMLLTTCTPTTSSKGATRIALNKFMEVFVNRMWIYRTILAYISIFDTTIARANISIGKNVVEQIFSTEV